ncbi:MAG: hypothetical protein M3121_01150 [Chloroflexota bacterium]|nr:hypothetical protein [Chloroflexota bacterium]
MKQRIHAIHEWVALRNRLIHVYATIIVWDTISDELDGLVTELDAIMRDTPPIDEVVPSEEGTNE